MGRTILCPHCKSTFDENVLAKRSEPNICPVCEKPLDSNADGEEHSDWITWYYYGHKSNNGKTTSLRDQPIDLNEHGDTFFLDQGIPGAPKRFIREFRKSKRNLENLYTRCFYVL